MCGNMGGGASSTSTQSSTKPITYASPSEKDQMKRDITNQFFDNYRKYGADGEKANKMIIDGFLKEGLINNEMAESLRRTDSKVKRLEVDVPKSNELQKRAEQAEKRLIEKQSARSKAKKDNEGGLGLNSGYTAVTSTYKRFKARQKRKFDEWWKGNH